MDYFQKLLSKHHESELPNLSNLISKKITMEENDNLVRLQLDIELNMALKSIPISSSSNPDSFGSSFYVSCWDIIKAYLLEGHLRKFYTLYCLNFKS